MVLGFGNGARGAGWPRRRIAPVYATNGIVAAADPLVATAGLDVLRRGGNAVDAAITAALVASVVMPDMCGLGGDLFALVHDPASRSTQAVLGSGISPRGATIEQMRAAGDAGGTRMPFRGPLAVGVPGMVDAYFTMLSRWGTRPFAALVEPAIAYAEHGHPITHELAELIALDRDVLAQFPSSAATLLPGGQPPAPADILKQVDLARTLRAIAADGPDVFYRGDVGKRIVDAMAELGGAMMLSDFADHQTVVTDPISTRYRGHTIYQTGVPSQGLIMLEALNILEAATPHGLTGSASDIHVMVEAKKLAYADRMRYAVDSSFGTTPLDRLLSKEWATEQAKRIDPSRAATDVDAGVLSTGDTTYLCVVDRHGMMVSLIQSVSAAFGCGLIAGDTGVVLNNRVGRGFSLEPGHVNVFEPGKKTMHTLNCYLIADLNGDMVVTGGTPGGDGQPQWNVQAISAMIDSDYDVQAAIEAPRWTSWPGTDPSTLPNPFELRIEARAGSEAIEDLDARGHTMRVLGDWDGGGAAQIIARNPATGVLAGGTDPRVEGLVAGY